MKALGIVLILISLPLMFVPLFGVPLLIIGIIMIASSMGEDNAAKTAKAIVDAQAASVVSATAIDDDRWAALVKYDDEIAAAHAELVPLGDAATAKFKNTYLALNDKANLPRIVADIKQQHAAG